MSVTGGDSSAYAYLKDNGDLVYFYFYIGLFGLFYSAFCSMGIIAPVMRPIC